MMNALLNEQNVYENFDLDSDVLYFRIGIQGLVSFHGRNYNRKRSLSASELQQITTRNNYFPLNSSCYINVAKIKSIADGIINFGTELPDSKQLPVNRRKQSRIEELFKQRTAGKEARKSQ